MLTSQFLPLFDNSASVALMIKKPNKPPRHGVLKFGSPKVGDQTFVDHYNQLMPIGTTFR